jgi:hypothetical protein
MTVPSRPPKYRPDTRKNPAVVRVDCRDHRLGRFGSPESWTNYSVSSASDPPPAAGAPKLTRSARGGTRPNVVVWSLGLGRRMGNRA